jgi:DNA-nicking Smr family endonuclease
MRIGNLMATVFDSIENNFYNAFFIPDAGKRRSELSRWISQATPLIERAVREELKTFVETITKDSWTKDSWRLREEKLRKMRNDYHIVMDIKLRRLDSQDVVKGRLPAPVVQTTELDLHGMTIDEAIPLVDKFLQKSYLAHECRVWIVHGKGEGILRGAIRQYLRSHNLVKSFAPADINHGEEGATQVDLLDRRDKP